MEKQLAIYSLGGLTLHYKGQLVTGLASRKMEALLVYLAYTKRIHSREHLADLFWTDTSIEIGLGNLRVSLTRLRKSFPDLLISTRQSIGLVEGTAWNDAGELVQQLRDALAQWRSSSRLLPVTIASVESAIALYQGKFMEGLALKDAEGFDAWVSQEREHILETLLEASYALVKLYQQQNSHENAKRLLQNVIRIEPLEERSYHQLMQVYWHEGQRGKALEVYKQLTTVLDQELGIEPNNETQNLYHRIQSGEAGPTVAKASILRLPQDSSVFVGRQNELADITSRLRNNGCRLLTILGLGGIGKTRVAIAVARTLASDHQLFPDGIFFVGLEDTPAPLMISRIGNVLSHDGYTLETLAQLQDFLTERRLLLILDNFEHLVEESEILSTLLNGAPNLKILVASRERLRLREEWLYDLHGLHCPQNEKLSVLETSEAVQLLHSASKQVGIQLALGRDGREIVRLCQLVEGMPLALEMAASLIRDFGLEELLKRMEANIDILRSNLRNTPQRHMSLRVLFNSIWERLSGSEKTTLLSLSVFTGHISQEAAVAVAGAKEKDLAVLQSRLLLREGDPGRFRLHPLVRQYAFEILTLEPMEVLRFENKHADYFAHFVGGRATILNSHHFRPACDAIELEFENIRSAWLYAARTGSISRLQTMLQPLVQYHMLMERNQQGILLFEETSKENLPPELQGWILSYQASFLQSLKQFGGGQVNPLLDKAEAFFRLTHTHEGQCYVLLSRGRELFSNALKTTEALEILEEAERLARALHHEQYIAEARLQRGSILSRMGHYREAEPYFFDVLAMNPQNPQLYAECLLRIGTNHYRRQHFQEALIYFERVLEFDRDTEFELHYATTLIIYGSSLMGLDRMKEAEQSFLQSLAYFSDVKNLAMIATSHERLASCYQQMHRLDEALSHLDAAKGYCKQRNRWDSYVHLLVNFALMFQELGWAHPTARLAYQEAIEVAEREGISFGLASAIMAAGLVELLFENYPLALSYLKKALPLQLAEDSIDFFRQTAQGLFRYAIKTQNLQLAAWLKVAFEAHEDTDSDIQKELEAAGELPIFNFSTPPDLLELETYLDGLLAISGE